MIFTFVPYSEKGKKNLYQAYDNCMNLIKDDDIAIFMDHDCMNMQPFWFVQIEEIIKENPDFGLLTCMTNRVNQPMQRVINPISDNSDIMFWRKVAEQASTDHWGEVNWINPKMEHRLISGLMMVIRKSTWNKIKPLRNRLLGLDNEIHRKIDDLGMKVGIMKGVVCFHWYRLDDNKSHLNIEQ